MSDANKPLAVHVSDANKPLAVSDAKKEAQSTYVELKIV